MAERCCASVKRRELALVDRAQPPVTTLEVSVDGTPRYPSINPPSPPFESHPELFRRDYPTWPSVRIRRDPRSKKNENNIKIQKSNNSERILVAGRGSEHVTLERRPATVDNLTEGKTGWCSPSATPFRFFFLTDRAPASLHPFYNLPSACGFSFFWS